MLTALFYVVLLIIILVLVPFFIALTKVVSSGGSLYNLLKTVTGNQKTENREDYQQRGSEHSTNTKSQTIVRIVGGIIFSIDILSYPILFGTRRDGLPYINLGVDVRIGIFSVLVVLAFIVFTIIWYQDRKSDGKPDKKQN